MKIACKNCGSSDANHLYEDGHSHCFACNKTIFPKEERVNESSTHIDLSNDIATYRSYPISSRGISQIVVDHFGVKMGTSPEGKAISHYYPYTRGGDLVAYKERILPKSFRIHGEFRDVDLFGTRNATGGKKLVITEGEIDALSVAEAYYRHYKHIYPAISLPSATALKNALNQREWLNSFDQIILMMDNDEAGEKALDGLAKIIKAGKARVAILPEKDANETLLKHGYKVLLESIWGSREWSPAGIVTGESIWDQFKKRQEVKSIPYPPCLEGLNEKLEGMRHGEITLFTSGTGSGKSTVIKEVILDLLEKTEDRLGLISLEESIGDTAEKFISMVLERPIQNPPPLTEEDLRKGFNKIFGDERLVLLDHQGSVGDASLIDKIEHMALMGCKYLVLDHITIAVSEGSEGLKGNEAVDKLMSDLLKIVKKHNIWLGLISHLRKSQQGRSFEEGTIASIDDIKGSGSIKQISFDVIAFARNLVAEDESERNTIKFRVLKSRFTGRTGDAGSAIYNPTTTRLRAAGSFEAADFII